MGDKKPAAAKPPKPPNPNKLTNSDDQVMTASSFLLLPSLPRFLFSSSRLVFCEKRSPRPGTCLLQG